MKTKPIKHTDISMRNILRKLQKDIRALYLDYENTSAIVSFELLSDSRTFIYNGSIHHSDFCCFVAIQQKSPSGVLRNLLAQLKSFDKSNKEKKTYGSPGTGKSPFPTF